MVVKIIILFALAYISTILAGFLADHYSRRKPKR